MRPFFASQQGMTIHNREHAQGRAAQRRAVRLVEVDPGALLTTLDAQAGFELPVALALVNPYKLDKAPARGGLLELRAVHELERAIRAVRIEL